MLPKYYEKLKPTAIGDVKFESIHGFDRLYQITATIDPDGKATLSGISAKTDRESGSEIYAKT